MARSSKGISLVSVLVALALLATTAVAVSRLIVTGFTGSRITRENFIAIQIAREGLELIRAQRDSNWFTEDASWVAGLCDTGSSPENVRFDSAMALQNPMPTPELVSDPANEENTRLYRTDDGQFVHDTDDTEKTIYSRLITIACQDKDMNPEFIEVTSTVLWTARGTQHDLALKEKMFNWFPLVSETEP